MSNRQEVFNHIKDTLVDLFEIEPEAITGSALLGDDLDIDSIDAVDLIVELKKYTGQKLAPEAFKSVRTVDDLVDVIAELMAS